MNHINIIENHIHSLRKTSVECDAYQSGEELIRFFRDGEEQYDVIFLDMEMEKLNGIETANYEFIASNSKKTERRSRTFI